jgi:hypothetical protein
MTGASTVDESPEHPPTRRDYSALIILAVLGAVEVAILNALIPLETPLTPLVHRLVESPPGVFALVIWVVGILIVGMWGFTSWAAWLHKKRTQNERAA